MPRQTWTFSVDLDGLLCESGPPDKYAQARPKKENIKMVNELYDRGYIIIINTARSWANYELTKKWLARYEVKHTELVMGKVNAHYYIDDRNADLHEVWKRFCLVADTIGEPDGQMRTL